VDQRRTPRRALFSDGGRGLRASWHAEQGTVVLSLWQADLCVGTFRLAPREASRLADFLLGHAGRTTDRRAGDEPSPAA